MSALPSPAPAGRRLTWPWFLVVVVVYLAILQGLGALIAVDRDSGDSQFPTTESIIRSGVIPIGLSVLFGAAVVTWLGWWGSILRYRVPVRHWVRFVPISMLVVAVLGMNYPNLADQPLSLVLSLIVMTLFVGIGEELMFRGIGVQVFRRAGLSEGRVALWSSVIFGIVHLSNAFSEGVQAILQAVVVSTSGYFFYLCLRVGGTILLPMLVHGLWDFSLVSNSAGIDPKAYPGMILPIVLQVVLIVLVIVKRHTIEPVDSSDGTGPHPQTARRAVDS
ncbi:type II CAAX prenyl endopeptidase Rce1 family protein [Streptomyces sp. NPDC008150]|uniref:CPBP family intramembrane glutamic endopeptidase n=1 Tax=Streptomyces sp. NPDC008150 TaxID=3364816 RepID=UPI0036EE04E5